MKKKIIKALEKIAVKHGADNLEQLVKDIYCNDQVSTLGDQSACEDGYIYSADLKKCVPDIG